MMVGGGGGLEHPLSITQLDVHSKYPSFALPVSCPLQIDSKRRSRQQK
jgi:hypothetical protein